MSDFKHMVYIQFIRLLLVAINADHRPGTGQYDASGAGGYIVLVNVPPIIVVIDEVAAFARR